VQFCTVLGSMGYGITCEELHSFVDSIVNQNVDNREHVKISKHVIDSLLARHKEKVKIVSAASLDPKRARQANSDTRDAMFYKLNSYIQMLYSSGKIPWSTYDKIPSDSIFNMDELGNDTTKHRNKILQKNKLQVLRKSAQYVPLCGHPREMAECPGI